MKRGHAGPRPSAVLFVDDPIFETMALTHSASQPANARPVGSEDCLFVFDNRRRRIVASGRLAEMIYDAIDISVLARCQYAPD